MIDPRMAKVNARVAMARAALCRAEQWKHAQLRALALRDLQRAERRQRHLRRMEQGSKGGAM